MEEIDWADRAFYDDGEWVTWSEIDEQLRYKEWGAKYPNAKRSIIPYFEDLISLAESYHLETGLHLSVYGDIGELFGAITYGIELNKTYAQGSDGRLGNDHVEIKTITPFKTKRRCCRGYNAAFQQAARGQDQRGVSGGRANDRPQTFAEANWPVPAHPLGRSASRAKVTISSDFQLSR